MARASLSADGSKIVIETLFREKDRIKQLPGATWNHKLSAWQAPLTWGTCVTLRGIFGNSLEIEEDLTLWAKHELETRVAPANALREALDAPGSPKLFGYQRAGVEFLATAKRALLCDGLGAGKTRQALMTAMKLYGKHLENPDECPSPFPILVVCPNSTKTGWKREAALIWPELVVEAVKGSAAQRRKSLETPAHCYIMNWEAIRGHSRLAPYGSMSLKRCKECGGEDERISHTRCEVHPRELNQMNFGMVIADECFLGHVLINTPSGKRPIQSLRPGDVVWGYDHETRAVVQSRVLAVAHRESVSIVPGLSVTPNHGYYVADEGYRPAGDLTHDDILFKFQDMPGGRPAVRGVGATHDVLERLPVRSDAAKTSGNVSAQAAKLQKMQYQPRRSDKSLEVLSSMPTVGSARTNVRMDAQTAFSTRRTFLFNLFRKLQSATFNRTTDVDEISASGSLLQYRMPSSVVLQNDHLSGVQSQISGAIDRQASILRKEVQLEGVRKTAGSTRTLSSKHAENASRSQDTSQTSSVSLGPGTQSLSDVHFGRKIGAREAYLAQNSHWTELDTSDTNRADAERSAAGYRVQPLGENDRRSAGAQLVRSGPSVSEREADRGSGRLGSSREERVRRSTDSASGSSRLHRHPLLELRDPERYARVCAESALPEGQAATVYSLTTETGNYFAGDLLVRNCHRSKAPQAKQTRALWAATGDAPYRIGLTGTPIANSPDDMWAILHWLEPKEWPSRTRYLDRFCDLQYNAFGAPIVTGIHPDHKDEFFKIVNPRMRRMPKELVLSHLPPRVWERRDVDMTPKQKKAYDQMRDQLVAELDNGILTTSSPLTKMTRLLQFSSSFAELEETTNPETGKIETKARLVEPSCKIDAFMDDLPDYGDDSIVVFAQSRQLIYLLHHRMEKADIPHGLITGMQDNDERQQAIDDFQSGKTKYILCTLGAGGTGLTLTAARVAVYLQRSWSLVENEQSEGRVHRIGSEKHESILYVDYVTTDSVEEVQHQAVAAKGDRLEEILRDKDLLRRALENKDVMDFLEQSIVHDEEHNDGGTEGTG